MIPATAELLQTTAIPKISSPQVLKSHGKEMVSTICTALRSKQLRGQSFARNLIFLKGKDTGRKQCPQHLSHSKSGNPKKRLIDLPDACVAKTPWFEGETPWKKGAPVVQLAVSSSKVVTFGVVGNTKPYPPGMEPAIVINPSAMNNALSCRRRQGVARNLFSLVRQWRCQPDSLSNIERSSRVPSSALSSLTQGWLCGPKCSDVSWTMLAKAATPSLNPREYVAKEY